MPKLSQNDCLVAARQTVIAIILTLLPVTDAARADIILMTDVARGITMTQAQCAAIPLAVWINVLGRNLCMRYYYSTAGGAGSRPVVFLQGDLGFNVDPKTGAWTVLPGLKDTNTDDLVKYADQMSQKQKTAAIYLARMGRDGSSGWHRQRHTVLEVQATNAALDAIKQRYGFAGFHVYGHSGGGLLVAGLLTLRQDMGCAVPADGILAPNPMPKASDSALQYFDAAAHVATIAQNRAATIDVITDPKDTVVKPLNQTPFVQKLQKAGGKVDQFFVNAADDEHHLTTPDAEVVVTDCLGGASHNAVVADLEKLDAGLIAAAAKAKEYTGVPMPNAPVPSVGSVLPGIDFFGSDYSNSWLQSADPTLCQKACIADAKCAAWTYVQPGVQGTQARCWLKSQVPEQSKNPCCTSGVERLQVDNK